MTNRIDAGEVRPILEAMFPLSGARQAQPKAKSSAGR
jgi:hypothetical protein